MRIFFRIVLVGVLAGLFHLSMGWEWTLLAAFVGGYWTGRRGWLLGAAAVGLDYLVLLMYNYAVDASAVNAMTLAMGALLGNMPSSAVVAITLLIGAAIGALGGAAGTQLRRMTDLRRTRAAPA